MEAVDAREIIKKECESKDGLDMLFRMSEDVETERIEVFIHALRCLEEHYEDKPEMEKDLAYQLFSMYRTLQGSMRYWKVSRPEGLDENTCSKIFEGIMNVFSS